MDVLISTLTFGTAGAGGRPLSMLLMRPTTAAAGEGGPLPVIVGVHGGAFRAGSKEAYVNRLLPFARRGYVCAAIEYRLSPEAPWPAQIQDCKCAVRYLRAHARELNLDPERIGAWGSSAGGHLVAMLGVTSSESDPHLEGDGGWPGQSSAVQAVCDWFGPVDFLKMVEQPSTMDHNGPDSPEGQLLGATVTSIPDLARAASPITHVDGSEPPFLVMHGTEDPLIPHQQSVAFYDALSGGEVTFVTLHGAKHGGPEFDHPTTQRLVHDFFDRHLRTGQPDLTPWEPEPAVPGRDPGPPPEMAIVSSRSWHNPGAVPPLTEHHTFTSAAAGGLVSYALYLPSGYKARENAAKRYPVIYWLHGMGGDPRRGSRFMAMLDEAIRTGLVPPAIAVLANGGPRSMYVDAKDGTWPVETVIVRELVPHVDATYRTIPTREGRCIEGQSMGGFGAARFGFGHPELFCGVSISAGALISLDRERPTPRFRTVWRSDAAYFEETNPRTIVRRNADAIRGHQHVRIFCGTEDRLLEASRTFHALLDELEIPHEYTEVLGAEHGYDSKMDRLGQPFFGWFARVFEGTNNPLFDRS
jgi:acetyl esterase/lipase